GMGAGGAPQPLDLLFGGGADAWSNIGEREQSLRVVLVLIQYRLQAPPRRCRLPVLEIELREGHGCSDISGAQLQRALEVLAGGRFVLLAQIRGGLQLVGEWILGLLRFQRLYRRQRLIVIGALK